MKNKISIGERWVGEGQPCFIIAEAGVNHNGKVALAKKLIDAAVKAGADAVKFQTFHSEDVITAGAAKARYQQETTGAGESQLEMVRKLELNEKDFKALSEYALKKGIMFLSTPFDTSSVDFLDELGVPAFKIASGEITNFPLLHHIARKNKPVILSTGMSTMAEVANAIAALKTGGAGDIALLHCISSYPAGVEDMNLKFMETLRQKFRLPVGLSDHSQGITVPIAAAAMGACIIEKHFTLDQTLPGPDHRASLEPDELSDMIRAVRDVEEAMGSGKRTFTAEEKSNKKTARRSIVAARDIPAGTVITEAVLAMKRPGTGMAPGELYAVVGRKTRLSIKKDALVKRDSLE